jgi:hypothetical protein
MTKHTCVPKLLFNKAEAAMAIGYKARALDYAIASGELQVVRHGTRVLISREALETFASKDRNRMTPVGRNALRNATTGNTPEAVEGVDGGY